MDHADILRLESLFRSMGLPSSAAHDAMNDPRMRSVLGAAPSLPPEDPVEQFNRVKESYEKELRLGPSPRPWVTRAALPVAMEQSRRELKAMLAGGEVLNRRTNVAFPKHSSSTPLRNLSQSKDSRYNLLNVRLSRGTVTLSDMQVRKTHIVRHFVPLQQSPYLSPDLEGLLSTLSYIHNAR